MSPRRQTRTPDGPHRSTACRIGTHDDCAVSSPALAPVDVPVIYEACDCPCHSTPADNGPAETAW